MYVKNRIQNFKPLPNLLQSGKSGILWLGAVFMSVNEKIRSIRETKGLTQEQVAEKAGISASVYGDIERGENDPKLSKLQKIAEAFEIQLSELVDLSDKGNLNVSFTHQRNTNTTHQNHVYVGSCATELKEQKLINELKDKELAMKDREIDNLREIIALLKKQTTTTET
jgi:transcriptional regulator with XRE-family HTH domain